MCLSVYLASNKTLGLVPEPAMRGFHVEALNLAEKSVRKQFRKANVVYVGSSTGCSCGFQDDDQEGEADRAALAAYVARASGGESIEMFVCWNGDEAEDAIHRLRLSAVDLLVRRDWLQELSLVEIHADAG